MVAHEETLQIPCGAPENSDTILDTPITWTMVENDIQKALNTTAKFGDNKKAELIGLGDGNISKIVVATLDWNDNAAREELPETIVVKITDLTKFQATIASFAKGAEKEEQLANGPITMHSNELAFYRLVIEEWKLDPKELKIPSFYCGREWGFDGVNAGYIAVEHVKDVVMRQLYRTVSSSGAIEALQTFAKIHALFYKNQSALKRFGKEMMVDMFADCYKEENLRSGQQKLLERFPECQHEINIVLEKIHCFTAAGYKKLIAESCQPPVLCHGDTWPQNLLWTENEDGTESLRAILDFQGVHVGSPVEDIVVNLALNTSAETKSKHLPLFFDKYYEAFVAECAGDVEPPFTKQQFIDYYEKLYPHVAVAFVPYFLPFIDGVVSTAPDKVKGKEIFDEKLRGMIHEAAGYIKKWY